MTAEEKQKPCPITGLPFFMEIEDQYGELQKTYGGPFDSYTIPVKCGEDFPDEYNWRRFCHDEGLWMGWEMVPDNLLKEI